MENKKNDFVVHGRFYYAPDFPTEIGLRAIHATRSVANVPGCLGERARARTECRMVVLGPTCGFQQLFSGRFNATSPVVVAEMNRRKLKLDMTVTSASHSANSETGESARIVTVRAAECARRLRRSSDRPSSGMHECRTSCSNPSGDAGGGGLFKENIRLVRKRHSAVGGVSVVPYSRPPYDYNRHVYYL